MNYKENFDLSDFNTFGVSSVARFFVSIEEESDVVGVFSSPIFKENKRIFLGGGSNILFVNDFDGLVVKNNLKGIKVLSDNEVDKDYVLVRSMSGEPWQSLVEFAVEKDLWGLEKLSLIPGTVGGGPVQNIGAYGVELKDVILSVEAYEVSTGKKRIFDKEECGFGYRDSVFKGSLKGKYFISAIVVKLSKKENKSIEYGALQDYVKENNIEIKSPKDVSEAIKKIRKSKLPDPKILGNAGSFFKNVFISKEKKEELLGVYPDMPSFENEGKIKIPTGWLIDICGFKGKRFGSVGVHKKHALILVNYGGSTGEDIYNLSQKIVSCVKDKFGINISPEVNLIL